MFVRLLFTEPLMRELYADWEEVARLAIAQLRMESARYPGDPRLTALVEELSAHDAQFLEWWTAHDVAMRGKGVKKIRHPVVGELALDWNTLTCGTDPDQHIIAWNAEPGSPSHDGLRLLASWPPGLLASWPPGLLASWPPGLLASWPPGLLACGTEADRVRHRRVTAVRGVHLFKSSSASSAALRAYCCCRG